MMKHAGWSKRYRKPLAFMEHECAESVITFSPDRGIRRPRKGFPNPSGGISTATMPFVVLQLQCRLGSTDLVPIGVFPGGLLLVNQRSPTTPLFFSVTLVTRRGGL